MNKSADIKRRCEAARAELAKEGLGFNSPEVSLAIHNGWLRPFPALRTMASMSPTDIPFLLSELDKMITEHDAAIGDLARYQEAERQGRKVVPPCKVGDTVYLTTINKEFMIEGYSMGKAGDFERLQFHCRCKEHDKSSRKGERNVINVCPRCAFGEKCFQGFRLSDYGKTVFPTREEAEAALAQNGGRE